MLFLYLSITRYIQCRTKVDTSFQTGFKLDFLEKVEDEIHSKKCYKDFLGLFLTVLFFNLFALKIQF